MRLPALLAALSLHLVVAPAIQAGEMSLQTELGGAVSVKVTSLYERRFRTTIKQQYDFSCGSAALATLLKYHFEHPTTEQEVFQAMFEAGDKEKIRREGFSLLDMKRYLETNGYKADGFRMPLAELARLGVPAITLINEKGYRHFVVIKGVTSDRVLFGDPATGARSVATADFEAMHTGIYFLILSKKDVAQANFNLAKDWHSREPAPISVAVSRDALGTMLLLLPNSYDF